MLVGSSQCNRENTITEYEVCVCVHVCVWERTLKNASQFFGDRRNMEWVKVLLHPSVMIYYLEWDILTSLRFLLERLAQQVHDIKCKPRDTCLIPQASAPFTSLLLCFMGTDFLSETNNGIGLTQSVTSQRLRFCHSSSFLHRSHPLFLCFTSPLREVKTVLQSWRSIRME